MSLILGGLGERIRNYLNGRYAINRLAIADVVQPIVNVERMVNDYTIKSRVVAVGAINTEYACTTGLKATDYRIKVTAITEDAGISGLTIRIHDDEGQSIIISEAELLDDWHLIPSGWWLTLSYSTVAAGNVQFDAIFEFFTARNEQGVA